MSLRKWQKASAARIFTAVLSTETGFATAAVVRCTSNSLPRPGYRISRRGPNLDRTARRQARGIGMACPTPTQPTSPRPLFFGNDRSMSTPPAADSFWRFSQDFYALPGVAPACLALQDGHGRDVNLVLYGCWLGMSGRGAMGATGRSHDGDDK